MTEQATDITNEGRIVRALGRMPWLPAATNKRVRTRDFSLETLADILEELADYLVGVAEGNAQDERELRELRADVDAVRRVFGRQ